MYVCVCSAGQEKLIPFVKTMLTKAGHSTLLKHESIPVGHKRPLHEVSGERGKLRGQNFVILSYYSM
jgi:hypothetical protein